MGGFVLSSQSFPALEGVHRGTGTFDGSANDITPDSVAQPWKTPLEVEFKPYKIRVLSLEIDTDKKPNWFGVGFRVGVKKFDTVNLFCHPDPDHAGMRESDYKTRSGEWPKLFRYVEQLAWQIAISGGNHITIVPFFPESVYGNGGIFATDWVDIVNQAIVQVRRNGHETPAPRPPSPNGKVPRIADVVGAGELVLQDALRKAGQPGAAPVSGAVSNVVLSCYSRGRQLAAALNTNVRGLKASVKEVWDFDGVGPKCPAPRVMSYDQQRLDFGAVDKFHVPPERWINYHKKVVANVHGDVPYMLARHASQISRVGR